MNPSAFTSNQLNDVERGALKYRNRAMQSVYWRGVRACEAGDSVEMSPYSDRRDHRNHITFALAFARAWKDGWLTAARASTPEGGSDG